jgi:hypothetical protein
MTLLQDGFVFSGLSGRYIYYGKVYVGSGAPIGALRGHQHYKYPQVYSVLKLQNLQIVNPVTESKFFHPFMQSLCMFVGETLVGLLYLGQWLKNRNK